MHDKEQVQIPPLAPDEVYSVSVKLKPKPCEVYITSNPSFAEVKLDKKPLGTTPLDYSASPGEHLLEIEKDQYDSQELTFSCEQGQHLDRAVFLVRAIYTPEEKAILAAADFWRKTSKWTLAGSVLLGAASYWQYSEFEKLDQEYTVATKPAEIEDLRLKRDQAKTLSSGLAIGSGVGLGLSFLFYKWGVIPEELLNRSSVGFFSSPEGTFISWQNSW